MKTSIQKRGYDAEQQVVDYLQGHGYAIAARNYTTCKGEIDIIARKDSVVAFIEVKMRSIAYFNLSLVVTVPKQRKIITVARHYVARTGLRSSVLRFDVVLVQPDQRGASLTITHIRDAFTADESVI